MTRFDHNFSKIVRDNYPAEKTPKKDVSDLAIPILIKTTIAQSSEYLTSAHSCFVFSCPPTHTTYSFIAPPYHF